MAPSNQPDVYRFGAFTFTQGIGLTHCGKRIRVPPKEAALLELLLRRQGGLVSHRDIETHVWPQQVVTYASVARCVCSLRGILQLEQGPQIVTVPKRGYQMAVPVRCTVHESVVEKSTATTPAAYSHFLQGQREANRGSADGQQRAIDLFTEAQRLDRNYAVPLAAVADCEMYRAIRGYVLPRDALKAGLVACEEALRIDPQLASAHAAKGWFEQTMNRSPESGWASLDRAISIDPDYARAFSYQAWLLRAEGRLTESVAAAEHAVDLDPHAVLSRHALAYALFCAGRPEEALAIEREVQVEQAYLDIGHAHVALLTAWLDGKKGSLESAHTAARISGRNPLVMTVLSYTLARAGDVAEARRLADTIGAAVLPRAPRPHLAMTYVALGDHDRALELLSEARRERCPWFPGARFDPRMDRLTDDPRLKALYA